MRRFVLRRAVCSVCMACCAWPFQAGAIEGALSLDEAVALALRHHPEIRVATMERDAALGAARQAGALPNPEFSALVEDTRHETRTTTFQLNQPIELGGKRAARIGAAEWAQRQADTDLAARQAQVKAQAMAAFFGVALAQERKRLAGEMASLAARATEVAARRVAAGKVSPVEEVKARVAQAQARSAVALAQSEWRMARQQLLMAIGDEAAPFDHVDAPVDALPPCPDWPEVQARMDRSPALSRARQEIQRRAALTDLERAKAVPDMAVNLGMKRDQQLGRDQPILGVSLVLPLFDRNAGGLLEARRREDKAHAELAALQAAQTVQVREAHEQLSAALDLAKTLRGDVLPGARQALDAATRGYEMGKFGFLDVLDAQRTLFEAETQVLAATAQAFKADARLLALLGEPGLTADEPAAAGDTHHE